MALAIDMMEESERREKEKDQSFKTHLRSLASPLRSLITILVSLSGHSNLFYEHPPHQPSPKLLHA